MSSNRRTTVVLADDHPRVLESVSQLLQKHYNIVAAVNDGRKAVDAAIQFSPEVIVLDISMPVLDGFGAALEIRQLSPKTRIIFLSVQADQDYINKAVTHGAAGYVLKSRMHADLIRAIESALNGKPFFSACAAETD